MPVSVGLTLFVKLKPLSHCEQCELGIADSYHSAVLFLDFSIQFADRVVALRLAIDEDILGFHELEVISGAIEPMVGIQVVHLATRLVYFFCTVALAAGGRDIVLVVRYGSCEIEGCDEEESYFAWTSGKILIYEKVDIIVLAAGRICWYEQGLNLSSRFVFGERRRIVSK